MVVFRCVLRAVLRLCLVVTLAVSAVWSGLSPASATPFTMNVPGTSLSLPADYPQAGGVAIVMVGANGNAYYQFSNPTGAFQGYQNSGSPTAFRGNPFTINNPITLDCGYSPCTDYFGGSVAKIYIRFTAYDGDTQVGGFDFNDITLRLNGFDVANWSTIATEITDNAGTTSFGTETGFGNNTLNTGWFTSTNSALAANILSTGQTTSQVYDRDPNDNYWDFRIGNTLSNSDIVTVAPGYTLTKVANRTTFAAVGDVISYTYEVTNIGSVPIRSLQVSDDKIVGAISCTPTVILDVNPGQTPNKATCLKTYTVTQADFDAQKVVNIAKAIGVPDYGTLGERTATVTVTGPALAPALEVLKTSSLAVFGAVGTTVPYNFRIQNTGNATLTNVVVTDPKIPALSCTYATLAPGAVQNCSGSYTVKQSDVDAFAAGTRLVNTASVTARDPRNLAVTDTTPASLTVSLPGPTSAPAITMTKVAQVATFDAVGNVISYKITLTNSGNVTWPAAPAVTDPLAAVTCPTGSVAPGASIVCLANYTVNQANLNAGKVDNTAAATITVGGVVANATASATVPATRRTTLLLDKRLSLTSPTSYAATGVQLVYSYDLTNTGNVTLNAVSVTDNKVAVTCPVTTLAPGATTTCTSAAYPTTQADINAGSVVNVATANATAAGTNAVVVSNGDTVSVPAVQKPALTLTKTAPIVAALDYTVGQVVSYSYTVQNSGNVQILAANQLSIVDDKAGTFNCGTGDFAQGASRVCTRNYTLTSADVAAGFVINKATANAGAIATSNQATAKIAPSLSPGLTLVKSADVANVDATTDVITYTFTITNSGNAQIVKLSQPITVSDPMVATPNCAAAQPMTLNAAASYTCTATYSPTQVQLNAGVVRNTATASYPFNGTTTVSSPSSTATVPVVELPGLELTKSGAPSPFTTLGQQITYSFGAKNTGNVTLTNVVVTDPKIPALSCTFASIAPSPTASTCTGVYTVNQADVDAGVITNTATAQGRTGQGGTANASAGATIAINPLNATKTATLNKVANRTTFAAVGDTIIYTMNVANTGTRTLNGITVTDALDASYTCAIPTLVPGATNSLCTLTYRVIQADVNRGSVINLASAASADFTTLTSTRTVTGPVRTANYVFTKTASSGFTLANDVVTFTLAARNTGNTTLTNLVITDTFFNPDLSCTIASLDPGITNSTCAGSYTVTQADVDAGSITNTANATASAPSGVTAPAPKTATAVVNGPISAPKVAISKTTSGTTFGVVGTTKTYNFSVTNTGNVTLTGLRVQDASLGFDCQLANLAPGASTATCAAPPGPLTATKTITQADLDTGAYSNTAKVTGTSLIGAKPASAEAQVILIGPAQVPALQLVKDSASVPFATVGQSVAYTYVVKNIGNITLTAPITVADNKISAVSCPSLPPAGLPPLGTITCTGTYRVTQDDLNAGSVTNNATASITQPVIPANPGDPSFVTVTSAPANETVAASQLPSLSLDKRIQSTSAASYSTTSGAGSSVTFEYVVTNTGNVTTTAPVNIADDKIPGTLTCAAVGLAPGASATCEQVWTANQAALDAGSVTNIAVATTVYDGTPRSSAPDSATVTAVQVPKLGIVKSFVSTSAPGFFNAGDRLTYEIVVTNTGNVSIDAPIALTDSLTTPVCPAVPGGKLAPAATLICSASHVVTVNDLDLGAATNVVSATGQFNGQPVKSPSDDAIYPVDSKPALALVKTPAAGATFNAVGNTISYSYSIDNTGNVGLVRDIYITDDKLGAPRLCRAASFGAFGTADAPYVCSFVYTIVQADVDRGFVTNNATANTVYGPAGSPTNVVSPNATATVNAVKNPGLTVDKVVSSGPNPAAFGDVLTYLITTTNTGNQTISGVAVADPKAGPLVCTVGGSPAPANVVLAPTGVLVCTATYTVKQSDVDSQLLINTATARGSDPQGGPVTGADQVKHPLATPNPQVVVTKAITPPPGPDDAFSLLGQPVSFVVTVRNAGNITLLSTNVVDDLVPGTCTVGRLAPGEEDSSCTYTYFVKQSDLDRQFGTAPNFYGGFINTATGVAQPANPGAATVSDAGDVFAKGPAQEPKLTLAKEAQTADFDSVGDVLLYRYIAANTGNVTLIYTPVVFDDKIPNVTCDAMPAAGLAPGEFLICLAMYNVSQDDVDLGKVTNIANVSSVEVTPSPDVTVTVLGLRAPSIDVVKTPSITTNAKVGDVIAYDYVVTNTGNVSLTAITLADDHTSAAGTAALTIGGDSLLADLGEQNNSIDTDADGVWTDLGPGDVISFAASYTVTQADVDAGAALANTVTVMSISPAGTTSPTDTQTVSVPVAVAAPAVLAIKSANVTGLATPPVVGNEIVYTITVQNVGNVTLNTVVLSDTFVDAKGVALTPKPAPVFMSGDTNSDGQLDETETWAYTARFVLNQQAIDAGGVSNQIVAAAVDPFNTPVTDTSDDNGTGASDPTVTALAASPDIAVVKSAVPALGSNGRADVGDTIAYTYTVTNPGNVTLFDLGLVETGFTGTGPLPVPVRISGGTNLGGNPAIIDLAVGGTATYQVTYTLTQADVDTGKVDNQATVTAKDPSDAVVDDLSGSALGNDTVTTTPLTAAGSMLVLKTANISGLAIPPVAGNTVSYSITVANTGNLTLKTVALTDTFVDAKGVALALTSGPTLSSGDDGDALLEVGETWTYVASYTLTQAAIDAGGISNSVLVAAKDLKSRPISDTSDNGGSGTSDPTVTPFAQVSALDATKTANISGLATPPAPGNVISFTITVRNAGNVTLSAPVLTDTLTDANAATLVLTSGPIFASGDTNSDTKLSVGETWRYSASFTLTQAEIDAGGVSNTVLAQANNPALTPVTDRSDDGDDTDGNTVDDPTVVPLTRTPKIAALKTATLALGGNGRADVGDVVTYDYTVTNSGNVTVFDIGLTETGFTGTGTLPVPVYVTGGSLRGGNPAIRDLTVGESATYRATYALTQADVNAGFVDNRATAAGTDPAGNPVHDLTGTTAADNLVTRTTLPPAASMDVVKTASSAGLSAPPKAGDGVPFTITVANTGNVTLKQVALTDTFTRRDGTVLELTPVLTSGDAGVAGDLEVAETWTYTVSYVLVQADIDAGGISNTVVVASKTPANVTVSDTSDDGDDTDGNTTDDPTVLNFLAVPNLTLAKTLATGSTAPFTTAGQVLTFDLLLTNTGNISLTAPIAITDALVTGAGGAVSCPSGVLAPAATRLCSANYTVTQADVDLGSVLNSAVATITQPVVPSVSGGPISVVVTTPASEATATATRSPALIIDKRIKAGSATSYDAVDDIVTFEYVVTNTGNVTIAGPVTISDNKIAGTLTCSAASLAPAASVTCQQNWIATLADLNAGSVTNLGVANGTFDGSPVASPSDSVTITAVQNPSLAFEKTLIGATPDRFNVGSRLDYGFVVTNSGNVTIAGPIAVADSITTVACDATPAGGLLPGGTVNCTANYVLRPGDIAQGATTNVATASGTFNGLPITSASDSATYPVSATPALTVVKDSVPPNDTFATLGEQVRYRYTVTNTGLAGFSEDITISDNKIGASFKCRSKDLGTFNVGDTVQCEAVYSVTQADLDDEQVVNEASAISVFAPGTENEVTVTSPVATKTVSSVADPKLRVVKDVATGPFPAALGDVLGYRIVVTNSGNQTISGVAVSDPMIAGLACTRSGNPVPANLIMAPGDVVTCLGDYTVTQTDVNAQVLTNTATAGGKDPQGVSVAANGTDVHPLVPAVSSIEVTKALLPDPGATAAFTAPGQGLTFAITVRNTGNITLNAISVTDNRVAGSCAIATLAPGASDASCRFNYTTTQADIDAVNGTAPVTGGFTNSASVTAQPANPGASPVTDTGDVFVKGPVQAPAFGLDKTANVATAAAFGDQISYTYVVTNRGNITLTDAPRVTDDKIANLNCAPMPAGGLAPLATLTCTALYSVTQADVDAGGITNIARVVSDQVTTPVTDVVTVTITPTPGLVLTKVPSIALGAKLGDVISYTYTARNSGNTSMTAVTLGDQHSSAAGTVALVIAGDALKTDLAEQGNSTDATADGIWDRLGPGDEVTFTARYTVTQADVDAGTALSNTATVTATGPAGTTPPADETTVSVPMAPAAPVLEALKLVDRTTLSSPPVAGEVLNYTITLANKGNVTLTGIGLVDRLRRTDGTILVLAAGPSKTTGDGGMIGTMEVAETWTYTASYTLTQADIDAGGVSNQVDATARTLLGVPVRDLSDDGVPGGGNDPTLVQIPASPSIAGEKTITAGPVTLGSTVQFLVTATNTGNVTLRSVAVANDTLTRADGTVLALSSGPTFAGASAGSGLSVLKPGEVASYTATYVLVQADIDAGGIVNTATITGTPPLGGPVTDITDDGDDTDGNTADDTTVLPITAAPSMGLVKRLAVGSGPTFNAVGQVLNFEFEVTNTGNVTITAPITVADPLIAAAGGAVSCALPPLAPGAKLLCAGSYTVKQSDLDAGQITNVATASSGPIQTAPATRVVPAQQLPALSVVKLAEPVTAAGFVTGAVVNYSYTVTNNGNITLTAPIRITDNRIKPPAITCPALPAGGLIPTGTLVCTASYTVTADDVDLGSVTNLAKATDGTTTSPIVTETIPDAGVPALAITKVADAGSVFDEVGDTVGYTFRVTNSGTRAFAAAVSVVDDRLGTITCFTPTITDPNLTAGEFVTCTAIHTVTQADLDAGRIINQAYARTSYGAGSVEVVSQLASVDVAASLTPGLTLTKTSWPNPVVLVGQVVTYALVATNSGNQTLRNIEISDPKLPSLNCATGVLLRGQVLSCEGTVAVTQADVDRGTLVNTATVAGITPQGGPVGDTATETTRMPVPAPALDLVKTATPTPFGAVGSNLTYQMAVTNIGNVTMTSVVVTDPMDATFRCVIPTLAPGVRNATCAFGQPVTQAQIDAGTITNTASVTGTDPFGTSVGDTSTLVTAGPARVPGIEAVKLVLPSGSALGSAVRYRVVLRNTGNVSLTVSAPVDTMSRLNDAPTALDAPFALMSGDTDDDGLLDVTEIWTYAATHTLTQDDIDAGGLSNSVVVNATGPNGAPVSDISDNGDDSDGNTVDDPTVFDIARTPALTVTKTVTAQSGSAAGDTVSFGITAVNTGNSTITAIDIADTMRRADGVIFTLTPVQTSGGTSLAPGAQADWTLSYTLTQVDVDSGGFENSATVSGVGPSGEDVRDVSTDGDGSDGNITDDPTVVVITPAPSLEVIKTLVSAGAVAGEEAVFTITATNRGNVTLSGVAVVDTLTRNAGPVVGPVNVAFASSTGAPPSSAGTLKVGEAARYTARYVLTQADINAGGLSNSATVTAASPLGAVVRDISDKDGTGSSNPTPAPITGRPSFSVVKSASAVEMQFPTVDKVTFTLTVQNTGNTTQTGIQLADDLAAFIAPAVLSPDIPVVVRATGFADGGANAAYNGTSVIQTLSGNATLLPGQTGTVQIDLVYSTLAGQPGGQNIARAASDQLTTPTPSNPVTVTSPDTDGDGVSNALEGTGDRDGDGIPDAQDYDPTGAFYCQDNGQLLSGGRISVTGPFGTQSGVGTSNNITILRDGTDGRFQFYVTAAGSYALNITYPSGGVASTTRLTSGVLDATTLLPSNPGSIGANEAGTSGRLADFTAGANRFYTTFVVAAGDPHIINNNIPLTNCADTPDVLATKTADRSSAKFGEVVNFTLVFENNTARTYEAASLVDLLPDGLIYTAGSATLNGVAAEPTITAKRLVWGPRDVPPADRITIRLAARVVAGGSAGSITNRAQLEDSSGAVQSNVAAATIRIVPEAVFDCSDVIGKVFDDKNRNGYQDRDDHSALTDDDVYVGKYGNKLSSSPPEPKGEPGLPGVRLATVNGLLITTDEYGRYHVPCAAMPQGIGSNFTLKVDPRSLPSGYMLTTENPRVLRLTAGKLAKMNFGATLSNVVDVDLTGAAFATGKADPKPAFAKAVAKLVQSIKSTPSVLRLGYLLKSGEDRDGAEARLSAAEKVIRDAWRGVGAYKLVIEKSIKRVQ